jgi:hypothetical protein
MKWPCTWVKVRNIYKILVEYLKMESSGSTVGIATGYRLDD